jgi:hypothetical protein
MMGPGFHHGWNAVGGGGLMFLGGLIPLLLLGLLVFIAIRAFSGPNLHSMTPPPAYLPPPPPPAPLRETALELAERRYANGDISRDEFIRIRDDLAGPTGTPAAPTST